MSYVRFRFASLIASILMLLAPPMCTKAQTVNFGTINVGQKSSVESLSLTFSGNGTLGSIVALTQGAANMDFAVVTGGTCATGTVYSIGNTCSVNATFAPNFAGTRNGAVVLEDGSGNRLAMAYISGVGLGPQLSVEGLYNSPSSSTLLGGGFNGNWGVAVDGNGNVFVSNVGNGAIEKIAANCTGSGCVSTVLDGFNDPLGIAIDGAGDLFIAESSNSAVREIPFECAAISCVKTLGSGFTNPYGVAVDGSGNVFVADHGNNGVYEILAAGGYTTVNTLGSGFSTPWSVAVDGSGNVFVADGTNANALNIVGATAVKEILAAGGYTTVNTLVSGIFGDPFGLAADGNGNVFVVDYGSNVVWELLAASGYASVRTMNTGWWGSRLSIRLQFSESIAVDGSGNLYAADPYNNVVTKLDFADPAAVTFATATLDGTTDTADGPQTVSLQNNGNAPMTLSGMDLPNADFQFDGDTTTCSTSTPIAAGASCTIGIVFSPTTTGTITGTLTLTDNNLNVSGAKQLVNLSALTLPPPPVIGSAPASSSFAATASFTFSDTQANVTFVCSLDFAPFAVCSSGIAYSSLGSGAHTFEVEAKDSLGNLSLPAVYPWTVTTAGPPAPVITSTPANPTSSGTATFTFSDTQAGVSYACSLDGAAFSFCNSGIVYSNLVLAKGLNSGNYTEYHTFSVEAEDSSNNFSPATTFNWITNPYTNPPASNVDFGTVAIGQTSAAVPITFTFAGSATIGSVAAVSQGATGLDFAIASAGTCTAGTSLSSGSTCTLNATFSPKFSGQRKGAVVVEDGSGNAIATGYLNGIGSGPQVSFRPYTLTTLGGGFAYPTGVAVDGDGNVFVAEPAANVNGTLNFDGAVEEIPLGCVTATCVKQLVTGSTTGIFEPQGIAIDGDGNLFVAATNLNSYVILAQGGYTTFHGYIGGMPYEGMAIDGSEDIITIGNGILDLENQGGGGPLGQNSPTSTSLKFSTSTPSVAVDASGNIFVVDTGNNAIYEVPASSNYTIANSIGSGFNHPTGVAVDGNGNVFVTDNGNNVVKEIVALGGYATVNTIASGIFNPSNLTSAGNTVGIALDGRGNVYLADSTNGRVVKLDFADAPTLTFATATNVGSADTNDDPQKLTVKNNGNTPLSLSGIALSRADFSIDAGATTCSTSVPLAAGVSCLIGVDFAPTAGGALAGTLTLTDNTLNTAGNTQAITLTGAGAAGTLPPAPTITSAPATPATATLATFTFSDTQADVIFLCSLDSAAFAECSSGIVYSSLSANNHTFAVEVKDSSDNRSAAATYAWTINAVSPIAQTIAFANPGAQTVGTPLTLTATATSGLAVSFASTTAGVCTVSGTQATFLAAGTCTIDATQAGNSTYAAAAMVAQSFTANAAPLTAQTIAFANPGAQTVGTPLTLAATATSGLAVSFASTTAGVCTVSGTQATFLAAGTCTIDATQAGNSTYAAAAMVAQSFTANAAPLTAQTIAFANPGAQTVGTPLTLTATATSGLAVSFASTTANVCTVSGTQAAFRAPGTCTIDATQAGNSTYATAAMVAQSFTVNAAPPPPNFTVASPTGQQTIQPGGAATYAVNITPVNGSFTGAVTLSASGLPAGATATFVPASVTPGSAGAASQLTIQTAVTKAEAAPGSPWPLALPTLSLIGLVLVPGKRRRRWITPGVLLVATLGAATALSGCGGGFALAKVTPPTSYTITVTGTSGADIQTTTVQLTVE